MVRTSRLTHGGGAASLGGPGRRQEVVVSQRNAVYTGVVVEPRDPKKLGRVRVSLPSFGEEVWARRATPVAGAWLAPDAGDEVLVAFENGEARRPIVVGTLWNAAHRPPEQKPERMLLRTRNGTTIVFDDGTGGVEVADTNGNAIKLQSSGVTVLCSAKVTVSASTVEVNASIVQTNAGISKFTGIVQCDTLIANSVVASSYTPGVGNVM
jgi:phage baseplate assembly protein V